MYKKYLEGYSTIKVGAIYGVSAHVVSYYFNKNNMKVRSNKENSRRYDVNHNFFSVIDTEEKAYWLGFMYADGYVSKRTSTSKSIGVSLGIVDKNHLEKFRKCLNSNYPVNEYKVTGGYKIGAEYCRLLIASDNMFDDLVRHGCVENKSDILIKPQIDNYLIKHFIRGYVDGDGSIVKKNREYYGYEYNLSILGTDDMLTFFSNHFLENKLTTKPLKLSKRKQGQVVSEMRYGGNFKTEVLLDYLYKDATIYLDRKYERYLELKLQNCRTQ